MKVVEARNMSRTASIAAGVKNFRKALPLLAAFFLCLQAFGSATRTQTFAIQEGWNAVYLAVDPVEKDPDLLFAGLPVDIVAVFDVSKSTRQFSSNPDTDMLRQLGWGMWYAPGRDDAFLSGLGAIYGNKAYLVHASESMQLSIEGEVEFNQVWWKPSSYNLIGFTLDATAPPTFEQFFAGSSSHSGQAVYRLVGGAWRLVSDPSATLMKNGEAFWVYCEGSSDYQGPLAVTAIGRQGIALEDSAGNLTLQNDASYPLQPTIEHVLSGADFVPLSVLVDVIGEDQESLTRVAVPLGEGAWSQPLPPLESGNSIRVPLQARLAEITVPEVKSLLCIKTDVGTETWVPVTGKREDLK
ncbi:hypothetical protein [Pontiella sulfatireligans]|uniref:Uncharacterized protein n=1 Tax=Pontiella sulfatireligans TaxID=2750658 RepID=A0A6C2UKJ5_9BACT|nr:hypothetical protein [Pontiella sulfatireligans]VGO20760.1 hypothetical protein SCARR_02827 [Pontiella sulfatireligans]